MARGRTSAGVYFLTIILSLSILLLLSVIREANGYLILKAAQGVTRAARRCFSDNDDPANETKCYEELGCFPMDKPWKSLLRPLPPPMEPEEVNVRLYCYTRESPERYNITLWPEISLEGCPFKASRKTAFVTHGFANNGNCSWLSELKDNYLFAVDANVFLVDWGQGAEMLNYLQVASNTRIVGAELARFIKWLQCHEGLQPAQVHLMGHSLGSHISAYAAKAVPGIGHLTAMDPAQPGFEGTDKEVRLDRDDADYVEVLHTNAAPFIPALGFGLIFPHGHVDFYLNGGLRQPGCHLPNISDIKGIGDLIKFPVELISMWVGCSHGRSYEYYSQVLRNNCTIWGRLAGLSRHLLNGLTLGFIDPLFSKIKKCDANSCLPLGLETPTFKARGTFAATTYKAAPYCETDCEVNNKLLADIQNTIDDAASSIGGAVKGVASKGKEVASGLVGKIWSSKEDCD